MVRLKEKDAVRVRTEIMHFNSTMVRLKGLTNLNGLGKVLFQFHYGSVKSVEVRDLIIDFENFNSTMVRLKGCRGCDK